jgi:hypothetical protein
MLSRPSLAQQLVLLLSRLLAQASLQGLALLLGHLQRRLTGRALLLHLVLELLLERPQFLAS